jgi:hypothetical protein
VRTTSLQNAFLDKVKATSDAVKNRLSISIDSKRLPAIPVLHNTVFVQRQILRASCADDNSLQPLHLHVSPPQHLLLPLLPHSHQDGTNLSSDLRHGIPPIQESAPLQEEQHPPPQQLPPQEEQHPPPQQPPPQDGGDQLPHLQSNPNGISILSEGQNLPSSQP